VPRWTFSSLAGMHLSKLTTNGHDVWLDDGKLQAGQDWDLEVRRAISTTDAVVV
jgi:hypothetical protein